MTLQTQVKLKKVGNSQAVIIPSNFLKGVDRAKEVEMRIEENEIRLVFVNTKSLQQLIDEKRTRNKSLFSEMVQKVQNLDSNTSESGYLIDSNDDLID